MSNSTERYQKLCIEESVPRIYRYPIACEELSFIIRGAYSKLPKHLQSLIFQHTLAAIRLLPEPLMEGIWGRQRGFQNGHGTPDYRHSHTGRAVAAAHLLLQSAEAAFPKQKKSLVVTEFKQAKVAHKRRSKAHREEKGPAQLPQDVLIHVFRLLDLQSLISAGLVCWLWNFAANDNQLWELQYTMFFSRSVGEGHTNLEENAISRTNIDWRETFKRAYKGTRSKKLMSGRGYCEHCGMIVWLKNLKCSNGRCELKNDSPRIKPISPHQVVHYVMDGYISDLSSSDSDSESDEEPVSRLWAYPRNIRRIEKKPIVYK